MKRRLLFGLVLVAMVTLSLYADCAQPKRVVDPIVSTQWLADNMGNKSLVLLDVRVPDNYSKGHIPGAVNFPGPGNFYVNLVNKWWELPEKKALFATIGKAGITGNSIVVVVGRTAGARFYNHEVGKDFAVYGLCSTTRVAITLLYAGIANVAILDGGYDKWASEGRPSSTEPVKPNSGTYDGDEDQAMFVTKEYVEKMIGKSMLVDARESDGYFGLTQAPWEKRRGHIPTAKSLPAPWMWNLVEDKNGVITYGTYKDGNVVKEIVSTVIGKDRDKEIIVYCGLGGYASTVCYILTQVAGHKNVKFFDGSMQEWTGDPKAQVVKYRYQ